MTDYDKYKTLKHLVLGGTARVDYRATCSDPTSFKIVYKGVGSMGGNDKNHDLYEAMMRHEMARRKAADNDRMPKTIWDKMNDMYNDVYPKTVIKSYEKKKLTKSDFIRQLMEQGMLEEAACLSEGRLKIIPLKQDVIRCVGGPFDGYTVNNDDGRRIRVIEDPYMGLENSKAYERKTIFFSEYSTQNSRTFRSVDILVPEGNDVETALKLILELYAL